MFKYSNYIYSITIIILFLPFQLPAQNSKIAQKDEQYTKMKENTELLETNPETALLNLKKLRDQNIKSNPEEAIDIVFKILDVLARSKGDNHELLRESEIGLKLAKNINAYKQLSYFHQYRSIAYFNEGLRDLGYRELLLAIPYTNKIKDNNSKYITLAQLYGTMSVYYLILKMPNYIPTKA